jgi:signal transduction histidine kinase/CheY-like chemotaxis protein/HPt (histidine-containing phosphotransfer) domain-containing protein
MTNLDYFSILAQNIPGIEVLLINNSYEVLVRLGTEAQKQGWGENNEVNNSISTIFPEEIEKIITPLLKIGFDSTPISREFTANQNHFSVRIIPLIKTENLPFCILIIQNITETKLIEKRLHDSMNEAKEASRAKDNFVARMSHEIRTPLNAISGFTEQLEKTRLTKKQSDYVHIVRNASKHLVTIIDDILLLSKIELGQIDHQVEPFKIITILKEIDDVLKIKHKAKNLDFKIQCELLTDEFLLGEPSKLRQVLINIANNAIKFTREGSISIKCLPIKDTEYQRTIRFEVKDTGIGIDTDEIKNIFKPFHQLNITNGVKYAGCGLGLTISKELVESMGGIIKVDSTPGKGSTFKFSLDFIKASKSDIKTYKTKEEKKKLLPLDKVRILFVDDDPVNLLLGRVILSKFKVKTDFSNSGTDALNKFKKGRYDIIFLDINLPDYNGIQITQMIRDEEKDLDGKQKTRIIAMTANAMKKQIETYMQSGIDSIMLKPYEEETLYRKIVAYATKVDEDHIAVGSKLPADKSSDYNLEHLLNFTKGDSEFTILMLDTFLESAQNSLKKMKSAYIQNDYNAIAQAAHQLIPSVKQLGLMKASRLLKKIEQRYLRKKQFRKDPLLIETAINELQKGIKSIKSYKEKIIK